MSYKIESLKVRNFKCFDKKKFYEFYFLQDANPTILSGPNGFGKTTFFGGIISLCERYMNISCHIVHLILPWLPSIGYPYQGQGSPQSGAVLPCG